MCRLDSGKRCVDIHTACQDRNCSAKTIRKIVSKLGVEVLEKRDIYGRVPLFYALQKRCSLSVVETLLDVCPNAILQSDLCGELPLYMLFHPTFDHKVLEYILKRYPLLALYQEKRFSGTQSLLQRLCIQWTQSIAKKTHHASNVFTRNDIDSDDFLKNQWVKLVLTVRAIHHITFNTKTSANLRKNIFDGYNPTVKIEKDCSSEPLGFQTPELHAALKLDCLSSTIICQFVEIYPEQVALPMTYTSIDSKMNVERKQRTKKSEYPDSEQSPRAECETNVLPLHYFLSIYTRNEQTRNYKLVAGSVAEVLKSIIRTYPQAASQMYCSYEDNRNRLSRLPLHMAIDAEIFWEEGLKEIVYANPLALGMQNRDCKGLLPFQYQAIPRRYCKTRSVDIDRGVEVLRLETIFSLLREDPSVLSRLRLVSQTPSP